MERLINEIMLVSKKWMQGKETTQQTKNILTNKISYYVDKALKNMGSSSRVIHSQPMEGYAYHVKFQPSDDYEIAFCHIHHKELQFKFFNGSRCNIETVSEWIPEPIIFIKG